MLCYYQNSTEPFLILARFEVELLSSKPYVALYHEVIYGRQIEELLSVEPDSFKSSKTVSLELHHALNIHLKDMTGMHMALDRHFVLQQSSWAVNYDKQQVNIYNI